MALRGSSFLRFGSNDWHDGMDMAFDFHVDCAVVCTDSLVGRHEVSFLLCFVL